MIPHPKPISTPSHKVGENFWKIVESGRTSFPIKLAGFPAWSPLVRVFQIVLRGGGIEDFAAEDFFIR